MLAVHFYILAVWLLLWAVFFGWGTVACRLARCDRDDAAALLVNPWIGIALVMGVLQVWHFVAPVGPWACAIMCGVGGVAAAIFGLARVPQIGSVARRYPLPTTVAALLILWLVNRSLNTQDYADHGLYYLNAIRWMCDYPIVPGLANLHNRLAFNNSNFLLHAMVEPMVERGYTAHVLNGLMAAMTVPIVVSGLRSIFAGSADERQNGWFALALAMILATSALDRRISSATPDFPAALLVTIAAWRLLAIGTIESESKPPWIRWNLLAIAMLATAAVTMKTTVVFFAALAGIALAACLYRLQRDRDEAPLLSAAKLLGFVAVWSALLFVPWVVRGYVLSGYPLFPSTMAGAPVDWAYDPDAAAQLRHDIYAWARTYHLNVETGYRPGWGWVPEWAVQVVLLRGPVEVAVPAFLCAVSLGWIAWSRFQSRRRDAAAVSDDASAYFTAALLATAYLGAIAFWFFTAPSPRMGSFAWWGLAATLLGIASRTAPGDLMIRYRAVTLVVLSGLLLLPMLDEAARIELRYRKNPNLPEFGSHFYEYYPFVMATGAGDAGFPPLPVGDVIERTTKSGLVVYVGKTQPDGKPGLLWDSPLPAARFFDPDLALRRPGDLRSGFKVTAPATGVDAPPAPRRAHEE